jgi:hypothetical protein
MAQMNTGTAGIWTTTNTNIMAMPPMMRQEKETVIHVDDGYPDPIDHAEDEEKKPVLSMKSRAKAA